MAESSIGWTTNGTGDGSASGYTMAQFTEWQRMLMAGLTGADLSGVSSDYLNELAATGAATPVAINTGGALVYGFPYFNSASVNVTIPTPSVSTRVDVIVLRASWAAQTVRITRVAGTEGAGVPAITQTAGTTWDMPLANASITTGGTITLTDRREWLNVVGDGAVGTAQLAAGAVTQTKLGSDTLQLAYIPIWMNGGSNIGGGQTFSSTSFVEAESRVRINKSNLPTGCTVKLQVTAEWPGGGATGTVELYNVTTAAAVTGASVATAAGSYSMQESSDFFANLASGSNTYACRVKTSNGTFGIGLSAVQLCVEW